MMMKVGWWFLLVALPALTQDKSMPPANPVGDAALVTFYSTGSFWKSAAPGYKYGAFAGLIFDGSQQLAHIRPGRFVTFSLPPGPHVFTTNFWVFATPKGGAHLDLNLVANHHYFLGTYFETTPLLVISSPAIEEVECQDAQKNATKAEPLARNHIKENVRYTTVAESSFPPCG